MSCPPSTLDEMVCTILLKCLETQAVRPRIALTAKPSSISCELPRTVCTVLWVLQAQLQH